MTAPIAILLALGVILAAAVALHGYGQWSIRNIDRERADGRCRRRFRAGAVLRAASEAARA